MEKKKLKFTEGTFQGTSKKYGFVVPDNELIPDIFISPNAIRGAIHGDRVSVRYKLDFKGARGEIQKILKRTNNTIVGTLYQLKDGLFYAVPDNVKFGERIVISKNKLSGAQNGQRVLIKIIRDNHQKFMEGEVSEVLGFPNSPGVEIKAIIREFGLSEKFPNMVEKESQNVRNKIAESEIKNREDLRLWDIVTIDGEDAKDFDDAVSIERTKDGFKLGVHIADVSYYVTENSAIDKEAFRRATSVYLVDRVLPMLPFVLSNGICSLKETEDRLTVSAIMYMDKKGTITHYEIFDSVIRVRKRLTYSIVAKMLDGKESPYPTVSLMKELALILHESRIKNGSLDFDVPESKVILGSNGKAVDIVKIARNIAHRIIEEFMLAANETVAKHLTKLKIPSIYRIHEAPKTEDVRETNIIIHNLGYPAKFGKRYTPHDLQLILAWAKDKPIFYLVNTLVLRALRLAIYSPVNCGHFGLAKEFYTHFTSPIRRYPDLIVHRILKESMTGVNARRKEEWKNKLTFLSKHSSEQERLAESADEATSKLKKLEYLTQKIGLDFKGVISGVQNYGFFVELADFLTEGLVHITTIKGQFEYNENDQSLISRKGDRKFKLGDVVIVKIIKINLIQRQLDLVLAD